MTRGDAVAGRATDHDAVVVSDGGAAERPEGVESGETMGVLGYYDLQRTFVVNFFSYCIGRKKYKW